MNVCFLTREVPNLTTGGVENVTFRLTQALRKQGHRVSWITMDAANSTAVAEAVDGHLCIGYSGDMSPAVDRFIADNRIEIVVNQAIDARLHQLAESLRGLFVNLKTVKVLHTDPHYLTKGVRDQEPLYCESGKIKRILYKISPATLVRRYRRRKYSRALYAGWLATYDKIVVLSQSYVNDIYSIAGTDNLGKVVPISNPIDICDTSSAVDKENLVLYVGRLHREAKRPDRLLEAWRKIHTRYLDWKLIFVGDGPMRESLERYCNRNNLQNVEFVGQTTPMEYYNIASISCITSTYEGFPLVCAESLSYGVVPVVFNSFGAVNDLIKDNKTGILVHPYDIEAYARCLEFLMNDENEQKRLQHNIANDKDFVNKFSMDTIVGKWEELFRELTK